jgi:hypothetical protein
MTKRLLTTMTMMMQGTTSSIRAGMTMTMGHFQQASQHAKTRDLQGGSAERWAVATSTLANAGLTKRTVAKLAALVEVTLVEVDRSQDDPGGGDGIHF